MEGLLQPDIWYFLVARYLRVRDLCALMACSKGCQEFWSRDDAWLSQRARMCAEVPDLVGLFDIDRGSTKKQKEECAIYRVFRHELALGFSNDGFRELCKCYVRGNARLIHLISAIVRIHVPYGERLTRFQVEVDMVDVSTYCICAWVDNGSHIDKFNLLRIFVREDVTDNAHILHKPAGLDYEDNLYYTHPVRGEKGDMFYEPWRECVLEAKVSTRWWTGRFASAMKPADDSKAADSRDGTPKYRFY